MTTSAVIDVKYVLVCDDIRREDNGKELIIGLYSRDIVALKFPINMLVAFWIQYVPLVVGEFDIDFRLTGKPDAQFFEAKTHTVVNEKKLSSMSFKGFPLLLQVPTALSLEMRQPGMEWEEIKKIEVIAAPGKPPSGRA